MIRDTWIQKAYSGQAKLWRVFWYGYVGTLIPVTILSGIARELTFKQPGAVLPFVVFVVVWLLYAWLMVSLWRCAPNSSNRIFLLLGRAWALLLAIILASGVLVMVKGPLA